VVTLAAQKQLQYKYDHNPGKNAETESSLPPSDFITVGFYLHTMIHRPLSTLNPKPIPMHFNNSFFQFFTYYSIHQNRSLAPA